MADGSARMVLIVDAEALIRQMIVDLFREGGFEVSDAESADAAFKVLAKPQSMPGATDGLSLAFWTRECLPETKIIVMSGFVSAEAVGAAHAFDAFLRKPLLAAHLMTVVESS